MDELLLNQFEHHGFCAWENFLEEELCRALLQEIEGLNSSGALKKAAIGKGLNQQVDSAQRGDFIHWIDSSECSLTTGAVLQRIEETRIELNRRFYLGTDHFECHFTQYPPGTFYKRHTDRHHSGSPRIVSFVIYLNENWQQHDGGQLLLYPENEVAHTIMPQQGTLALFLSELQHEVLPTKRKRNSITGWMRQRTN